MYLNKTEVTIYIRRKRGGGGLYGRKLKNWVRRRGDCADDAHDGGISFREKGGKHPELERGTLTGENTGGKEKRVLPEGKGASGNRKRQAAQGMGLGGTDKGEEGGSRCW